MYKFVVISCLVAAAFAQQSFAPRFQPSQQYYKPVGRVLQAGELVQTRVKQPIAILRQSSDFNYDGNFNYDFQSENGISAQTVGSVKPLGPNEQAQVMQGSYSYTAPDGTPITATWYADETGFHVEGDHLPQPPPIPAEIARSLEYLRSLPPSKDNQ